MTATYPTVSPLKCGYLSPPAFKFVADAKDGEKITMPSMSFLIQHPASKSKIVFDLSIRKDRAKYHPGLQKHIATRDPISSEDDVKSALALGGCSAADDIDYVIVSHVHWDHVGTPSDFPKATFLCGHDTDKLLHNQMGADLFNPYYEPDLLPQDGRTIELPAVPVHGATSNVLDAERGWYWQPKGMVPHAIDLFHDGTVYIVDSPGHVPGHLNMLVRIDPSKWVYLAADACHHARIFKGETDFGTWTDDKGRTVTIHKDLAAAYETLGMIQRLQKEGLEGVPTEVVLAHDGEWQEKNAQFFFPNHL